MRNSFKITIAICVNTLLVGSLVCYLIFSLPTVFARLNDIIYDFMLVNYEPMKANKGPVVIDIDERSIERIGQMPWPRTVIGDLVDTLFQNKVAATGLDIWVTEPDRSSPVAVDSMLEKNFGINLDFSQVPAMVLDNDRYMRTIISGKPVVLGGFVSLVGNSKLPDVLPDGLRIEVSDNPEAQEALKALPEAKEFIPPIPPLLTVAPMGILNLSFQSDGVARKIPLLVRVGEEIYPALSLLTLLTYLGESSLKLETAAGDLEALVAGEIRIPVEKDGSFRPLFHGPARTITSYSALDVIDGKVGRNELEGRIVFVGPSAHSLRNLQATPFDSTVPGSEIHATIVDNMLVGEGMRVPVQAPVIIISLVYTMALLGAISFRLLPLYGYVTVAFLSLAILIGGSWILFQGGIFLSPLGPGMALILSALVTLPLRFWRDQVERWKLKRAFNNYVAPEVVKQIINDGTHLLEGEYKDVTIMFSDVRGFTEISEKLAPAQLVKLLNLYFTPMTSCITARKGTMDKFIGDAIMAFWNAPLKVENHPREAVFAAIEMQQALKKIQPEIWQEFGVKMRMGIGVHSGLAHIGNMGSRDLLDYTCIGENVNMASRLEGLCKRYGLEIIVSEAVKEACGRDIEFILMDRIKVKGSAKPIQIYTPVTPQMDFPSKIAKCWQEALNKYFQGSFLEAEKLFSEIPANSFLDTARGLFQIRCRELREMAVKGWQGVWTYHEK